MSLEFKGRDLHLAEAEPRKVAALLSAAADLMLVLDGSDRVKDLSHTLDQQSGASIRTWRGRPISEVVEARSQSTLRGALVQARKGNTVKRFAVSHTMAGGRGLPVRYSALGIGDKGRVVLIGRDMRPVSELQSKLLANHQSMEQNSRNQRQAEAHYRLLFETGSDAIVIVEAESGRVREANPRAAAILGIAGRSAKGRKFPSLFDKPDRGEVAALLAGVLVSGGSQQLHVGDSIELSAELFRAGDLKLIMVRLKAGSETTDGLQETGDRKIETLARTAAEAIVLTDDEGALVWANESFLALAAIPVAAQALGKPLGDFFQWSSVEREVLFGNIRRHGRIRAFSGTLLGANGQTVDVALSAVAMRGGNPAGFGFVMRAMEGEGTSERRGSGDPTQIAENLVEMIGRVPMKDLVRDTTDVIERMCIEAALKLTGNNRASTARVLGLSRQALYLKMSRFGITPGDLDEP